MQNPYEKSCLKRSKIPDYSYARSHRRIEKVKLQCRSEIPLFGWKKYEYYKQEFSLQNHDQKRERCIERVDSRVFDVNQFRSKFEDHNIPCIITGLTKNWPATSRWTIQVCTLIPEKLY